MFGTIANFIVSMLWYSVFASAGWILFKEETPTWQTLLIVSVAAWILDWIITRAYLFFIFITCLTGCITLPFFRVAKGWVIIWGIAEVTKAYTVKVEFFWIGLFMSLIFSMLRFHPPSSSSSSSSSTSSATTTFS